MMVTIQQKMHKLALSFVDNRRVFGVSLAVKQKGDTFCVYAGDLQPDDRFFIASITKLFTAAVIFQLCDEGKIDMSHTMGQYLSKKEMQGLHVIGDEDYSQSITIEQLISHTSGLPDYFTDRQVGQSLYEKITSGSDQQWGFAEVLNWTKSLSAKFPPGTQGKAYYSDTNYQILGLLIEQIEETDLAHVFKTRIFDPLNMASTYLYRGEEDSNLRIMYYKEHELSIPRAMQSFGADGGGVSNPADLAVFIEAFFLGKVFNRRHITDSHKYNKIFFPLEYGVGYMRFRLPRWLSPFKKPPELVGHSGHSGSFAFYDPKKGVAMCGTINQVDKPSLPFRLLSKISAAV